MREKEDEEEKIGVREKRLGDSIIPSGLSPHPFLTVPLSSTQLIFTQYVR